jgi:5'-nucleotidase
MRVLLTNDDGIDSPGLHALARALSTVAEVMVVAPAENQSAVARSITIRGTLEIEERDVPGAAVAYAVSGTPVDCVRFAEATETGASFDVVVAGANLGLNLGDDVTYSGTVAAAMEGVLLGTPGLAVSQQSRGGELHHTRDGQYEFATAERIVPRLAELLAAGDLGRDVLLNVNCPTGVPNGVRVCKLGRRGARGPASLSALLRRRRLPPRPRYRLRGHRRGLRGADRAPRRSRAPQQRDAAGRARRSPAVRLKPPPTGVQRQPRPSRSFRCQLAACATGDAAATTTYSTDPDPSARAVSVQGAVLAWSKIVEPSPGEPPVGPVPSSVIVMAMASPPSGVSRISTVVAEPWRMALATPSSMSRQTSVMRVGASAGIGGATCAVTVAMPRQSAVA